MILSNMRNIGIMAHIDAGKTTTTERILYYSGKIHKIGEIDDGEATMDFMKQEQERGITIASAAITTEWKGCTINIIDTPGHVDFTAEVERSLRVLDGAVAVICAVGGVQPQTETVWHQADEFSVPRLCFINKMDRVGADFFRAVEDIQKKFGCETACLEIPIGAGQDFEGVIDLIRMKEIRYDEKSEGELFFESDIAPSRQAQAAEWREKLLDTAASNDDELGELYIEGKAISEDALKAALRRETIARRVVPCLCGSARHNQGVQPLIDAVVDFLPCPTDVPPTKGIHIKKNREESVEVKCDERGYPLGLVFKIQQDREMGSLCFVRMYSGKFTAGEQCLNVGKKKRERINRILRVNADKMERLQSVSAGDIAVFVGLKVSQTGDTLGSEGYPVLLESLKFPEPVISVAIESETLSDKQRLMDVIAMMSREDPTFTSHEDKETGQLIISGMGELHLDVLVTRMRDDFGVKARVGKPQVTYRESIGKSAEYEEDYSRVLGGKEIRARLRMRADPEESGKGTNYVCEEHGGAIPSEIYDALRRSVEACFAGGITMGYPCADMRITVDNIVYDELTSTPFAFEAAAAEAFDAVCRLAEPKMLEPVMSVDIDCPAEFVGEAIGQIIARGGMIVSMDEKANGDIIYAKAPMAKMFGFSTSLRSVTQGRASFGMTFSHFQEIASKSQA